MHPIAVQIGYADWLEVERALGLPASEPAGPNGAKTDDAPALNRLSGELVLPEDPLEYQRRVRNEWK